MLGKFTWKNEASGNSAEFCFDKWPHWPPWQTPTVLVNDRATDVHVSYSSDSSLHCLPIACCCPFPAALLGTSFVRVLETTMSQGNSHCMFQWVTPPWLILPEPHGPSSHTNCSSSSRPAVTFKYRSKYLLPEAEILRTGDCAALLQSSCDLLLPLYFQWVHSMWGQHWVTVLKIPLGIC